MDVARLRHDFPILNRRVHDRPLVYLDSAATSQKPTCVIDAVTSFYAEHNANVHRGVHTLGEEATDAFEKARERAAAFVGARDPREIVFTRGTTESLNLLAHCLGRSVLSRGDRVLTTVMEHHSNIVPWQILRSERGIRLDFLDIDADGALLADGIDSAPAVPTRVVTLTQVSNVLGTVTPIRELAERAHARGAIVIVDAAQSAPHYPIDVERLGVDFLVFSGHKTLGPTGIGVLWGRADRLRALPPYQGGGEMIREVHQDRVLFQDPPARFEAGTPPIAQAIGLGTALEYLGRVGWDDLADHERKLTERMYRMTTERFGDRLRIYGPKPGGARNATFSFTLQGVHPHDIASLADADGIALRSGHHCAQPLMERLGVPALTRASAYLYTLPEEIDRLGESLDRIHALFTREPVAHRATPDLNTIR
ncbi:MAG: aminotransferase class V-fold PLP-dependent enzyme [Thermoplasmata archaeon]